MSSDETTSEARRRCPYCAELVLPEAIICRYCQRTIARVSVTGGSPAAQWAARSPFGRALGLHQTVDTAYLPWLAACAFTVFAVALRPFFASSVPVGFGWFAMWAAGAWATKSPSSIVKFGGSLIVSLVGLAIAFAMGMQMH